MLQNVSVKTFEGNPLVFKEARPIVLFRDNRRLIQRRLRALVRHLEEKQVGELLDVASVKKTVIAQDVALVPQLLNDGGGCIRDEKL